MPVSYDQSDILKCNVAFSYIRYVKERVGAGYIDFPVTGGGLPVNVPPTPSPSSPVPPPQTSTSETYIRRGFDISPTQRGTVFGAN